MDDGAFSIAEFCEWAHVGRTFTFEQVASGQLRAVKANGRTLNGEIVHLIQQAMGDAPGIIRGTSADIHARLDELTAKVKKLEKRVGARSQAD